MRSLLKNIPLFHALEDDELDALERIAARRPFPGGHTIFWQDDPADALYVVISGWVKVYRTSVEGKEKIFQIFGTGEFFGEMALMEGTKRSATVETLEKCEMLVIHTQAFKEYALRHPQVLWKMYQVVCEKLRRLSSEMLDMSYRDSRHRLLQVILYLAERHGQPRGEGCHIAVRLTHRELANMVGANRETVTRLMTKLESDGVVKMTRHNVTVESIPRLRESLGGED